MAGGKRSAAEVLLELLQIVPDAGKLERMLEPANLLMILMARGKDKEAIAADLKKRLPGELLLEVLKAEPDPDSLLALCTAPVAARPSPGAKGASRGVAAGGLAALGAGPFDEASTLNKVASYGLLFAVIIPAMIVAGFFPEWSALSFDGWLAFATVGAAVFGMGYVKGRAPLFVGALGGALVAPGALCAIYYYTRDRETVLKIEIALAFFVGAAPGIAVYYALFKKLAKAERS